MPTISQFLGITIMMFLDEHNPPHFHAKYQDYNVIVEIKTGIVKGKFPPRALRHLLEWTDLHKDELIENWNKAREGKDLDKIEGLE